MVLALSQAPSPGRPQCHLSPPRPRLENQAHASARVSASPHESRFPLKGGISSKLGKVKGAEDLPAMGRWGDGEADGGHGAWGRGGATLPSLSSPSPTVPSSPVQLF